MNDIKFIHEVESTQKNLFPEFRVHPENAFPEDTEYVWWSPSYHFSQGLMTYALLETIIGENSTILSVGSGPSHFERYMVEALGVKKENVYLSDIDTTLLPKGYNNKFEIDMYNAWVNVPKDKVFDFIIFPRSIGYSPIYGDLYNYHILYNCLINALPHLSENGQIRIDGHQRSSGQVMDVIAGLKSLYPGLKVEYSDKLLVIQFENTNRY